MSKLKPPRGYAFEDDGHPFRDNPCIGIVRCPDGDMDTWARLSAQVLDDRGFGRGEVEIEAPKWGWFRWNPDPSRYYPQVLAETKGPGQGNWRGARVITKGTSS